MIHNDLLRCFIDLLMGFSVAGGLAVIQSLATDGQVTAREFFVDA